MLRLFIEREHWAENQVLVPSAQLAHLRARRVEVGDAVCAFHGDGNDAFGRLAALGKRDATIEIDRFAPGLGFAAPQITLALSVIANDRMDWAIQKAVELGVTAVVPILAARSQHGHIADKKRPHWQSVAASAAEQCGRARIATIDQATTLSAALTQTIERGATPYFAQMSAASIHLRPPHTAPVVIFIGPEGGWTEEELEAFERQRAQAVGLGHATLRAETAALAAVANLVCS